VNRLLLIPAAVAAALALPATASANNNTVTADCTGLTFNMDRTEANTRVTATVDGRPAMDQIVNRTFGAPVRFTLPNPDPTRPHTWVVFVDSEWNADQTITRSIPACTTPTSTTLPVSTSSTTTTPPTSTSSVDTVPGTTTPPSSSVPGTTTVITTPRPTTTSVPPVWVLPETGQDMTLPVALAALAVATGVAMLAVRRKGVAE
jgi:LPXTG-motif cell wall-anchored protein